MGCVLDLVRVLALGGSLGWAHSHVSGYPSLGGWVFAVDVTRVFL